MKKIYALLPLSLAALAVEEVYSFTFLRRGSKILDRFLKKKNHDAEYYAHRYTSADELRNAPQQVFEMKNSRGEKLRGFYLPCAHPSGKIAFIVHGYRSEHAETAGMFLDMYHSRGFDVFCPDHAAHGESEGRRIGYDYYESIDCLRWIDELRKRFGEDVQIILHGFSMGGATVLRMSADCPDNVRFIIDDSGFTSAERLIRPRLGRSYEPIRLINRVVGGYDLRDTNVLPMLEKSDKPIIFVHGRKDPTVPFAESELAYGAYKGPKAKLFMDDARHIEGYHTNPAEYEALIDEFTEKYFTGNCKTPFYN